MWFSLHSNDYLMKAGLEIRVGRGDLSSNVYEISVVEQGQKTP
jgi:hypothetical protein